MAAVTLHRIDTTRRMSRFYRLDLQPDLFGGCSLVREWGRIGRAGQVRATPYPTPAEATAALERQRLAKQRRGYASDRKEAASPAATTSCLGGTGRAAARPVPPPDRRAALKGQPQ